MRAVNHAILAALTAAAAFAQPSPRAEFEVASIRPSAPATNGQGTAGLRLDGAQVRLEHLTIKDYLGIAYRIKIYQISGPDWLSSDRWDISATIPAGKAGQMLEMLQNLLTDRFQLKFHHEQKDFPVYALVLAKSPLKLKEAPPDDPADAPKSLAASSTGSEGGVSVNLGNGSSWSFAPNHFEAKKLNMANFAGNIERFADRPIVDMTGLKGQYDFGFDINPEDYRPMMVRAALAAGVSLPPAATNLLEGNSSATLSDALERIGLKLETRKAPLDVIVVDQGSRTPTDN